MAEPTTTTTPGTSGKLTLHHLNHSQSQRILWLLCELFPNEPTPPTSYALVQHARQTTGKELHRSPTTLKAAHPLAKSPTLVTPEGRVIIESSAIASYLIATYDTAGRFLPSRNPTSTSVITADGNDPIRDAQFSSFANSSLMPIAAIWMFLDLLTSQTPWPMRPLPRLIRHGAASFFMGPEMERMWDYVESELPADGGYLLGKDQLSRADIMMSWPLDFYVHRGYLDVDAKKTEGEGAGLRRPKLKAYRERILDREAWKDGIRRNGGPGEYDLSTFK